MRISMKQFLDQGKLTLPERISLIRDVADGVDHLHTRPKPIVHSDLKSVNIMISSSNRAVITDFGAAHYQRDSQPEASRRSNQNLQVRSSSSTTVSEAEYSSSENIIFITGDQWTLRWAAPEVLEGGEDSIGCLPRDVWSLAWVAYEAFTGKVPFEEERRDFVVVGKIVQIRLPFVPKEEESKMIQQLLDFMVKCWSRDMASRPSANAFMKEAARLNPIVPVHNRNDPKIHLREGELWASDRKYDQAVESYKKAAKLYESNAMIEGHANVAHKLATVYKVLRKWHNAREWFKKGETLYRSLQDNIGVAFLLLGWASSEKDSGDIPGAISKYKTALNLFMLESDGRYGLGYTYVRLGSAHVTQGDSIRAHRAYDAALNVFEGLDDQRMVSHCNVGIGRLYLSDSRNEPADVNKRELLDKSINCFKAALNADEMLGIDDPRGQAAVLKGAGHVSFAQGNNSRAINYWKRAQATYRAVGDQRECDSLEERIRSLQRP
ncbi:hypothetical protein FRB90_001655 [Tulasnella sp. 427]|nr:hypothetical protein FRB90_001655 [Tulasnella sp. 427]